MLYTIEPSEDEIFSAVYSYLCTLFTTEEQARVYKGFPNQAAVLNVDTYVVIQPLTKDRFNARIADYDGTTAEGVALIRQTEYVYQVDCYGVQAPDWADIISITWLSSRACEFLKPYGLAPLYADEPQQLNIVNAENQYELRFMLKLHFQVDQVVKLPQEYFDVANVQLQPPADMI